METKEKGCWRIVFPGSQGAPDSFSPLRLLSVPGDDNLLASEVTSAWSLLRGLDTWLC